MHLPGTARGARAQIPGRRSETAVIVRAVANVNSPSRAERGRGSPQLTRRRHACRAGEASSVGGQREPSRRVAEAFLCVRGEPHPVEEGSTTPAARDSSSSSSMAAGVTPTPSASSRVVTAPGTHRFRLAHSRPQPHGCRELRVGGNEGATRPARTRPARHGRRAPSSRLCGGSAGGSSAGHRPAAASRAGTRRPPRPSGTRSQAPRPEALPARARPHAAGLGRRQRGWEDDVHADAVWGDSPGRR